MKNLSKTLLLLGLAALPAGAWAQTSVDAYNLSQSELRGTARFMSMGGAFTALGGDLSSLTQNPAGIGVYRGSEVGLTFDLNFLSDRTSAIPGGTTNSLTHFDVNTFGYVGTTNFDSPVMQSFSWGFTYNRRGSFARQYSGNSIPLQTSMSNYITSFTDGIDPGKMMFEEKKYNPYADSDINWMSILAFSGGIINPFQDQTNPAKPWVYDGLFQYAVPGNGSNPQGIPATTGTAGFTVQERGSSDEYSVNFGGNLANVVNWGLGIGITDQDFEQTTYYGESLKGANIPTMEGNSIQEGSVNWGLDNWKRMTATGVNLKFGVIVKPVQELRLGFAVHTPTWNSVHTSYKGTINTEASSGFRANDYTDYAEYNWNITAPWRMNFGVAGVIAGRAIVSADYEYEAYNKMKTSNIDGDFTEYNNYIASDFRAANTVRLGAEFRVTPQWSLRGGFAYTNSNVNQDVKDNTLEVVTAGTNPAYTLNNDTRYITLGTGYRYGGLYADFAFVNRYRTFTHHCFTPFTDPADGLWTLAPQANVTSTSNQLVLTLGYKF